MLGGPTEDVVKVNWPLAILASVAIHVVFVGALLFFSSSGDTAPAKTQETSAQPSTQTPGPAVEQEPDPTPPPVHDSAVAHVIFFSVKTLTSFSAVVISFLLL